MGASALTRGFLPLAAALAFLLSLAVAPSGAQLPGEPPSAGAHAEVDRVRAGLGMGTDRIRSVGRTRNSYGREAEEVEGWRRREDGGLWPVDQATYDRRSGRLSKYVNFENASRRQAGEAILPMSTASTRADGYLALFFPGADLALEGVERYRVQGRESVYYEVSYSPQPQEVPFLRPLVRILVDASTGNFYRWELAADHLGAPTLPPAHIGSSAAGRIAALFLGKAGQSGPLGGREVTGVTVTDIFIVRPNEWLGAAVPPGGEARAAWLVQFRTADQAPAEPPMVLFVDAVTGKVIGGLGSDGEG